MRGFSLIELMVALAVAAVVLAVAMPAWTGFAGKAAVDGMSNELAADIALARLEAVHRQARITLCAGSVSGGVPSCSGSSNWLGGRVVYCSDTSATGLCCPDGPGTCASTLTQQVLKVRSAVQGGTLKVTGPAASVVFHPTGAVTSTVSPLSFTVCKTATSSTGSSAGTWSGLAARVLTLGLAGQLLASDSTTATC